MTDQELKALIASLAAAQAETTRKLDKASALLGNIGQNQGAVAEEFFFNSLAAKPEVGGITFDRIMPNVQVSTKRKQAEFDIVLVNGNSVAVIEVKYKMHPSDIDKAADNLKNYREFYPEFKDYALYGGIAGFSVPPDAVQAAKEKGMFVLKRVGEVLTTDASDMRAFD
jgi:hypothetical protein